MPGEAWVCEAIRRANACRDPRRPLSLAFVSAILERWKQEGYKAGWPPRDAGRHRSREPAVPAFRTVRPWGVEDG